MTDLMPFKVMFALSLALAVVMTSVLPTPALANEDEDDRVVEEEEQPAVQKDIDRVTVRVPHGAHFRVGPDIDSKLIASIPNHTQLLVVGSLQGNWLPVRFGNKTGFVHKNLLSGKAVESFTEAQPPCNGNCPRPTVVHKPKPDLEDIVTSVKNLISHASPKPPPKTQASSTKGPLPHAAAIERALSAGLTAPNGYCALAVWRILLRAHLVHGSWEASGANAIDMGRILKNNGFKSDPKVCNRPGVVRVYNGNQSGRYFDPPMSGDTYGHIEILGLDHQYHSFYAGSRSITQSMQARYGYGSRRPLQSCWYKP